MTDLPEPLGVPGSEAHRLLDDVQGLAEMLQITEPSGMSGRRSARSGGRHDWASDHPSPGGFHGLTALLGP
jgi:hypothetical protein